MKIGLAVITYNRPEYLEQCLGALESCSWGGATERIVVVDEPINHTYDSIFDSTQGRIEFLFGPNQGVAIAKNKAFKELIDKGCDHIFILEDDIIMRDPQTCAKYIAYAQENSLQHLNFALHGPMNRGRQLTVDGVMCYPECVGAFSYYTREVLAVVGLMDEKFKNAWEHVEHTYRIAEMGYTLPFWFFADHPHSAEMLSEIPGSIEKSSIRPRDDWAKNINDGHKYWISKHGKWLPPRPNYAQLTGKSFTELLKRSIA